MIIGIKNHISKPRLGSKLNPKPLIATLTSTGTGAGVSTLRLWVTKDITLTLTDVARFYDNSVGTTNEGTTRTVVAGAMRTFYLKCPSGTASLIFSDVRNLVRWGDNSIEGWVSSTNAASIAANVESLTNLTYLRVSPSSTLSGSVAGLTNLTYVYVLVPNTLSGSVAGLTNLTGLAVWGSNTLSGSVAGLTNLTGLSVQGSNTLSGDIGVNNMVNGISSFFLITGKNQMTDYTAGAVWSDVSVTINPDVGYGYSSTEIDNILIDMANSASGPTGKTITLRGSSQPRTSASDAAVTTLTGRGCAIITN